MFSRPLWLFLLVASCSRTRADPTANERDGARPDPPATTQAPATLANLPAPPVQAGSMAPNLFVAGNTLFLSWLEPSAGADAEVARRHERHRLQLARFEDGSWSAASSIADDAAIVANWADFPSVARSGDGTLVAHWAEKSGSSAHAYDVVLARSTDGGIHWDPAGRAHDDGTATEHGFVSLVAEGEAVRAFWLDGRMTAAEAGDAGHGAGAMTLRTALVTRDGVSAGELLDERVCDCCGTAAAVTAEGPLIVYRDRLDDETRDIAVVRRASGPWSPPKPVHADGWRVPGCPVNGPAVAADGRRVAVAWYSYAEQRSRILVSLSSDAGRTFAAPVVVDEPRGRRAPIGRVDVVLDGDGAVVSWMASDREDAALLVARVAPDGRVKRALTVARTSAARDSGFPRMDRLGATLVLAWTEATEPRSVRMRALPMAELPTQAQTAPDAPAEPATMPSAGDRAPEYSALSIGGAPVSLASLRGHVVLLNLWATWCEPCRHELGELTKLHAHYAAKGLRIVAASVDRERTTQEIAVFAEKRKLPFSIWHDPADTASAAFGAPIMPASFVIDRTGTIAWSRTGAMTADDEPLARALARALGR